MNSVAVGIDLGTTRSVIAHLDNAGRPSTVQNQEGDLTTPSAVFFDRSSIVVGKEALKVAQHEPDRVAQFAKRELGQQQSKVTIGPRQFPPEVIQALVLQKLKRDAEHRLGTLDKCVVTVPACFNEPRRKATQDSGRIAGLNVVDIINEPTAAALAYGVQQGFLNPEGRSESLESVLVYDLGGGTFDVTIMDIKGNDYQAIGTAGDVYLGGVDWDKRIVDYVAEQFVIQFGIDPRTDSAGLQRLMAEAEDAKRSLTQREEVTIRYAMDDNRIQVPLNRSEFEHLCGDLIDRTLLTTRRVLRDAGREWKDLSRLLLVGGSSRMPMVEHMLESESGLKVDRSISADESVAHGAAIYAGILLASAGNEQNPISVSNVNSHDLGILGVDRETGGSRRALMIPRNSPLPTRKGKRFATSKDNQKSVAVKIVEGGDDEGNFSTLIGNCVVRGLPPNLPAKTFVDVIFYYQHDGRVKVVAQLPSIKKRAALVIERESGLTDDQLRMWKQKLLDGMLLEMPADKTPGRVGPDSIEPTVGKPVVAGDPQFGAPLSPTIDDVPDFSGITTTRAAGPLEDTVEFVPKDPAADQQRTKQAGDWKSRRKHVTAGSRE